MACFYWLEVCTFKKEEEYSLYPISLMRDCLFLNQLVQLHEEQPNKHERTYIVLLIIDHFFNEQPSGLLRCVTVPYVIQFHM